MTERERAEREIQRIFGETETRGLLWRSLFDHSFQFIGIVSTEGLLLEANHAALTAVGCTRDQVLGRPFWELPWWVHSEAAAARVRQAFESARRGEFDRFETTHAAADGQTIAVDFSLTPVRDENGHVAFLIPEGRDITERKRHERERAFIAKAERLLSGSLERDTIFERVAHHLVPETGDVCVITVVEPGGPVPVAVAHRDPEQEPTLRALAQQFTCEVGDRYSVPAVLSNGHSEIFPPVDAQGWDGEPLGEGFPRLLREVGARSFMCVPLQSRQRVLGIVSLMSTSPGKRYTARDLELAEVLAHRATVAVENIQLYEEARRAVAARDDLIAAVSHDLRSPLNAIVLNASLLARSGSLESECGEHIIRAARSMNTMIQDLMDLAKIEAGRLSLVLESHDPAVLVSEALEMLAPQARAKLIPLRIETEVAGPRVLCERSRVLRVFSNLVGNAIKFSREGAPIVLRVTHDSAEVRFEIQDAGPGISAEAIPHIFDRYWQARETA
ncbi:MAG: PAS domain S-box protein, partial [Deltaproteobacteria bacterium]